MQGTIYLLTVNPVFAYHGVSFGTSAITFRGGSSKERIITLVVVAVALTFLIMGIVLIAIVGNDQKNKKSSVSISKQEKETKTGGLILCEFSEEAKRVELGEFVDCVRQRILNFTSMMSIGSRNDHEKG